MGIGHERPQAVEDGRVDSPDIPPFGIEVHHLRNILHPVFAQRLGNLIARLPVGGLQVVAQLGINVQYVGNSDVPDDDAMHQEGQHLAGHVEMAIGTGAALEGCRMDEQTVAVGILST